MGRIFFIADPHFGHEVIMRKMERPFETVKDMDAEIIRRWNSAVTREDTVWVLGDYSLHDFFATRRITEALGGRKLLVRGNQDKQDDGFYLKSGFERVYDLPVLFEGKYILSHEPVQGCEGSGLVNLFGHVHTNPEYKDSTPNSFCLSCERIDYTPLTLDEILTKMGA